MGGIIYTTAGARFYFGYAAIWMALAALASATFRLRMTHERGNRPLNETL